MWSHDLYVTVTITRILHLLWSWGNYCFDQIRWASPPLTFYILFQKKLNRYVFKVSYTIDLVENKRVIRPKFNRACCIQASFMLTLKNILIDPDI